ncbi:MAG: helix-turn-helix domain-containing protein [Candidatus Omnitrophica bacterium]|nr:helix-turn-helix domain-containing protein [Candidatus Omnitrophota bacterium]
MNAPQYISVRESAQILGVSERKVMDLIEERKLQAYKIANKFLRLKHSEVMAIKDAGEVKVETVQYAYSAAERMQDFFYYNSFYMFMGGVIVVLLYIIFMT